MAGRNYNDLTGAFDALSITASDSTVIPNARALYIGVTGNVAVRLPSGTTMTFTNVPVGILPVQCNKVLSTGTTATGIIALL